MKVVILCGGRGTRLAEETTYRPKPMVMIGDRPILQHIMEIYSAAGYREFILPLGYKGEMIMDYFLNFDLYTNDFTLELGDGPKKIIPHTSRHPGWRITMARTGEDTLTGGRIKRIRKYLGDDRTFMVTYGDGVADIDLAELLAAHRRMGKLATVTGVRPINRFGELTVSGGLVGEFREKPQTEQGLINGGFFVFEQGVFEYLDFDGALEREPLERLARDGQLAIYEHRGFWHCMDTFRDMEKLNRYWAEGSPPWAKPAASGGRVGHE
ncbi:MAG TPA: glucose-1-phosphate cytidylyltransferase [bacterium]|nr:glucose-1-phosphate cytidylyltransferase [bacterium]HPJ71288.1 glucose-1-phosphate cytidylyltransferase [bacterium]HPQ66644.1 glucose-1-phosphate cytidylyltransferase [bacterium]